MMREWIRRVGMLAAIVAVATPLTAQDFDRYFADKTMRVDYYHTGGMGSERFSTPPSAVGSTKLNSTVSPGLAPVGNTADGRGKVPTWSRYWHLSLPS